jgi:hypothetical protein
MHATCSSIDLGRRHFGAMAPTATAVMIHTHPCPLRWTLNYAMRSAWQDCTSGCPSTPNGIITVRPVHSCEQCQLPFAFNCSRTWAFRAVCRYEDFP